MKTRHIIATLLATPLVIAATAQACGVWDNYAKGEQQ